MLLYGVAIGIGIGLMLWLGWKIKEQDPKKMGKISDKWLEEHRYQYREKDKI